MRTLLVFILAVPLALAGTPDAPELTDETGDCALAYGAGYLDIAAAWIDNEDEAGFDAHLQLAGFDARVAEGAGFAFQFEHEGTRTGALAFHSQAFGGGWSFWTGYATTSEVRGMTATEGAYDAATSTMSVRVLKEAFAGAQLTALTAFEAFSVDARPAFPSLAASPLGLPVGVPPQWLVCDEAASDATYTFGAAATAAPPEGTTPAASTSEPTPGRVATSFALLALVAIAAGVAVFLRRRS